ncbi:MAG: glycyl-radical enzyme activating protein [Treponema sp.]|jgi:pyruvate formate lyase activating enzyme|nr:glycyl-radical enzyme activating protein [Treponema sp.]
MNGGEGITDENIRQRTGSIFNIQFFSVHDGPGIRTTVFLKGCPLRCLWCHNPEGIKKQKHLAFAERKCVNCGACALACPRVHSVTGGRHTLNRAACAMRGACVDACPAGALEIVGREASVAEITSEIMREKRFYEGSEGGVTVSGGEPAMQPEFLLALVKNIKKENVHVALESSGFCDFSVLEAVLPYIDLFLYDCKETDPALHRKFTGVDNKPILENLRNLHRKGARILLRCPVVHGLNDRDDHFRGIAALSKELDRLEGVEILPYHKLAASKTGRMGLDPMDEYEQIPREESDKWVDTIRGYGGKVIDS